MSKKHFQSYIYPILCVSILFSACHAHEKPLAKKLKDQEALDDSHLPPNAEIAQYVRNILQDKNGNLWFGTNGYGVAHYDGVSIRYFTNAEGFHGQQVTGMTEDPNNDIWFATDQGVVKYNWSKNDQGKKHFINYTVPQYSEGQQFWSILADSKGYIWAGSAAGIFRFDGISWAPFPLPFPEKVSGEFITQGTSWSITEDRDRNIWFSTNGFGAFKYDGQSFTQFSDQDGLTDNSVDVILEDYRGNMWFGTRFGGVSRYDGVNFTNYTEKDSIGNNEVCEIYQDKAGNIWLSSEGFGVYRFDGTSFTNYSENEGLGVKAVQAIFEDREGRLWVGGGGGLYRFGGESFSHVTREGPWK